MNARRLQSARDLTRRGTVLLVVLVTIVLLSLAAYTFSDLMMVEQEATELSGKGLRARMLADSGVEFARTVLMRDPVLLREQGGLFNNPALFQGRLVIDSDVVEERGRFSVVAMNLDQDAYVGGVRFGLENESVRLNLNILPFADQQQEQGGRELLMALPGMTEEIADAILDFIDEDDEPREFGAEIDYYSGLDPPYAPKNGPLDSVEELLLVRGVTPGLLFGADSNRNGLIDIHEGTAETVEGIDNSDGALNHGWAAYLTLWSMEKNVNPDGELRIDLNAENLEQLYADLEAALGQEWATFIVAFRQSGPYNGSGSAEKAGGRKLNFSRPGQYQFQTILDLIGPNVEARLAGEERPVVLESPFPDAPLLMNAYLPILADHVTVNPSPIIPGRININQASRTVLLGIPGMEEEIVNELLSRREYENFEEKPGRRHETWLLSEAIVTLDEMKTLMPFVTAGGDVYRGQFVGYFEGGGSAARMEVVLDATAEVPNIIFWRDLSHLGRGYTVETLGVGSLEDVE